MSVSTLAPATSAKERKEVGRVISKVVREAARQHFGNDILVHVYLAGLWHGTELANREVQS